MTIADCVDSLVGDIESAGVNDIVIVGHSNRLPAEQALSVTNPQSLATAVRWENVPDCVPHRAMLPECSSVEICAGAPAAPAPAWRFRADRSHVPRAAEGERCPP